MYIHQHTCISAQQTFGDVNLHIVDASIDGKLIAKEPALKDVPPAMLRRMSKAVKMGIGAGLPLMVENNIEGVIIGTANGGMEDCIKFLNQIIAYDEGMLTPGNFVQSTPNAIAGQLSLIKKNHAYNATHVHMGLAFENALIDAWMFTQQNPTHKYLVGGVDEISAYNYNIDCLAGWYSKKINSKNLYDEGLPATIAGEGAAMFLVNNIAENAVAKIADIATLHTRDVQQVKDFLRNCISKQNINSDDTILISGENGDTRLQPFYTACEEILNDIPIVRYKHLTGEYPTAASFALWLACYALQHQSLPEALYKSGARPSKIQNIIIYNQYHAKQHSFIFVTQ